MTENQRLKLVQEKLNFKSQAEFSEVLGIKQGSLSDIYREKNGIRVSDSIKMKLEKEFSINIKWLETGEGEMLNASIKQIAVGDNSVNSNINGNIEGNVTISHNDFSNLLELQKGYQEVQKELNERLKTSQSQIDTLLEILKNK